MKTNTLRNNKTVETHCGAYLARVIGMTDDSLLVAAASGPSSPKSVRWALPPGESVRVDSQVIVLGLSQGEVAIAKIKASGEEASNAGCPLSPLKDGTTCQVNAERTRLDVTRADGTPLFRYEVSGGSAPGQGVITLENESMRIGAARGDLSLQAAGEVRIESRSLRATTGGPGGSGAQFRLGPRDATLEGATVDLRGSHLRFEAHETEVRSQELRSQIRRAVLHVSRLDAVLDVAVTTANNAYQQVKELLQQRAGTLRSIVAGTAQLQAREVMHRASGAYKVRSDKIHLG